MTLKVKWHFINVFDLDEKYDPLVNQIVALGNASQRMLAGRLGWSETKVSRYTDDLEQAGKVRRDRTGKSKAIIPC